MAHNGADVLRDGGGRRHPFAAVAIAGLSEHHPKQRGPLQRELDVGDGDCSQIVGSRGRGVRGGQVFGQLAITHGADRGDERIAVGVVPIGRRRRNPGAARHRAQ